MLWWRRAYWRHRYQTLCSKNGKRAANFDGERMQDWQNVESQRISFRRSQIEGSYQNG
jgi:hypothetical protein